MNAEIVLKVFIEKMAWVLPYFFVGFVFFLIGREIVCWYPKLSKVVELREKYETEK